MAKFLTALVDTAKDRLGQTHNDEHESIETQKSAQTNSTSGPNSRTKAKLDLQRHIASKLTAMSATDMEERFVSQQETPVATQKKKNKAIQEAELKAHQSAQEAAMKKDKAIQEAEQKKNEVLQEVVQQNIKMAEEPKLKVNKSAQEAALKKELAIQEAEQKKNEVLQEVVQQNIKMAEEPKLKVNKSAQEAALKKNLAIQEAEQKKNEVLQEVVLENNKAFQEITSEKNKNTKEFAAEENRSAKEIAAEKTRSAKEIAQASIIRRVSVAEPQTPVMKRVPLVDPQTPIIKRTPLVEPQTPTEKQVPEKQRLQTIEFKVSKDTELNNMTEEPKLKSGKSVPEATLKTGNTTKKIALEANKTTPAVELKANKAAQEAALTANKTAQEAALKKNKAIQEAEQKKNEVLQEVVQQNIKMAEEPKLKANKSAQEAALKKELAIQEAEQKKNEVLQEVVQQNIKMAEEPKLKANKSVQEAVQKNEQTPAEQQLETVEFGRLSDAELMAQVDALFEDSEQAKVKKEMAFDFNELKEKFLIKFDAFASGAMLEAGTAKRKAAGKKVAKRIISVVDVVFFSTVKAFKAIGKPFVKLNAVRKRASTKIGSTKVAQKGSKVAQKSSHAVGGLLSAQKRLVFRAEANVASHMANFITSLDKSTALLARNTVKAAYRTTRQVYAARNWADVNKKKLLAVLFVIMACGITAVSVVNYFTAYIYAYNGKPLGMVKSPDDVLRVLSIVNTQLSREHGMDIEIDRYLDITFERVISTSVNNEIHDMQDVFNRLTYMQDISTRAYALYIDGRRMAILDSEERINTLLEDVKRLHLSERNGRMSDFESVEIMESHEIFEIDTQLGRLDRADDILERIQAGTMVEQIHVVERGQTFSGIAQMHGITQSELLELNPDVTPARLSIDQELILQQAVPLLTIQTVEIAVFIEPIQYDTVFEDNPNVFVGEQTTRVAGILGEREVTARITRVNGFETYRESIGEQVLKESSAAIVVRGTRPLPPQQGTGVLRHPLPSGRMSSPFGMRWGRMHNGVDWAAPRGTPVRAADGGTVTFSGYRGAMGNLIIIDHGRGKETWYAHLNRRHVSRGDRVFQGQHIGDVGSTGRSTGPHLHFEVRIHGTPRNPLHFL